MGIEEVMLVNNIPILTVGRSGSTFIRELLATNCNFIIEEWFSPYSFRKCMESGDATCVLEYLDYVYNLLSSSNQKYGVKVTPDVCAKEFWGVDITNDISFRESIKNAGKTILILRSNPVNGYVSMIYSELTGSWHSNEQELSNKNIKIKNDGIANFVSDRILQLIDAEINIVKLATSCSAECILFFYEDLVADVVAFSKAIVSLYDTKFDLRNLKIPNLSKHSKDPVILDNVSSIVNDVINNNQNVNDLYFHRAEFFKNIGIYSNHFTLKQPRALLI